MNLHRKTGITESNTKTTSVLKITFLVLESSQNGLTVTTVGRTGLTAVKTVKHISSFTAPKVKP